MGLKDKVLVSIVLPFFNGKAFIKETLESICRQTFRDFEVIVVDDGSTRKEHSEYLKAMIDSFQDPRFQYHHKENAGLSSARNYGISVSSGPWIAFIDQDDLWHEKKLERQVAVMEKIPDINFIFTDGQFIGDMKGGLGVGPKNNLKEGFVRDSFGRLLKGNFVICSSVLFRRSILGKVGYSNPCFKICPDYEYIIRFAEHTDFYFITDELVFYRIHGANTVKNQLKQSAEVVLLLCDQRISTKTQKYLATYNLARNLMTLCLCWARKICV